MLYAAASTRHGIGSIIATISAQHRVLAAPCFAGAVAPFSSSCGSSSSLSESSSNSPRPSSDDDRQDIDRYINEQPKADGPVPTAIEQEEATRAAAGEHIFTEGDPSHAFTSSADANEPATESVTAPHTRHQSASTKDFGGDPVRIEEPDVTELKEGHAIPNESATTH